MLQEWRNHPGFAQIGQYDEDQYAREQLEARGDIPMQQQAAAPRMPSSASLWPMAASGGSSKGLIPVPPPPGADPLSSIFQNWNRESAITPEVKF
jgi:hypothetical protein